MGLHAVPGRMRFALWQLLVFLERWLSGNKAEAPGKLAGYWEGPPIPKTLSRTKPYRASPLSVRSLSGLPL